MATSKRVRASWGRPPRDRARRRDGGPNWAGKPKVGTLLRAVGSVASGKRPASGDRVLIALSMILIVLDVVHAVVEFRAQ
jgi:hypothetical protein